MTDTDTAIMVTTEEAAKIAGVSPRTVRRWINRGVLPSVDGPNGRLVSPADLSRARTEARNPRGHGQQLSGQRTSPDRDTATNGQETVSVSVRARQELEAVRDEWLIPLVNRIAELERENGKLEERVATAERERDEARARLKPIQATQSATTGGNNQNVVDDHNAAPVANSAPWWAFWRH